MPGIIFVTQVPVEWAIVLFSLAFFGQQSWSTLVMIVPTDLFERRVVASVAGLVGFGGAMGGLLMNLLAGRLLDLGFGYQTVFSIVGLLHVTAFGVILLTIPTHRARSSEDRHSVMKITEIRTRVVEWRGQTVPPQPHFCTNPMDLLQLPADAMAGFRFHGWLIVEIFTDAGHVGIGNAALAPRVTKQTIDLYLTPLLIGADPFDVEFLWQLMYRKTMAFGRKGVGMTAISAVDIALWDILGKAAKQPVFRLLGGRTKPTIPVYASRLYSQPLDELAAEAQKYKDAGYRAMKMRFGWGPVDGAAGHAEERRSRAHRARSRRRRHRHHGRRLHGLESRLRAPDDSAARAVSAALARRAGDSGRPPGLRRSSRR